MTNEEKQEIMKEIFLKYIEDYFKEWGERVKESIQEYIAQSTEDMPAAQREFYNWFDDTIRYNLTGSNPNHNRPQDLYSKVIMVHGGLEFDIPTFLRWFEKDIAEAMAKAEKTAKK